MGLVHTFQLYVTRDLGDANDDYIGCDTIRRMAYVYNSDNQDGSGSGITYGANPPAAGIILLKGAINRSITPNVYLGLTSAINFKSPGSAGPICEDDPSAVFHSYFYMKGFKRDGSHWLCPLFNPYSRTKFTYSGDPETNQGWNEYQGRVENCGGDTTGFFIAPVPAADIRFVISTGAANFKVNPGDTQIVYAAQLIARGHQQFKLRNQAQTAC